MRGIGLIVALAGIATPALAADRTGYRAIATGDLVTAEKRIVAERRIFPARPELMLNLAAVYRQTGREADARALYASVLAQRSVAMDMPSGTVASSHDIATRALGRPTVQVATR